MGKRFSRPTYIPDRRTNYDGNMQQRYWYERFLFILLIFHYSIWQHTILLSMLRPATSLLVPFFLYFSLFLPHSYFFHIKTWEIFRCIKLPKIECSGWQRIRACRTFGQRLFWFWITNIRLHLFECDKWNFVGAIQSDCLNHRKGSISQKLTNQHHIIVEHKILRVKRNI